MRSFFILLLRNDVGADTGEKEQFKYHWPGNFFFENNAIQKFGRNGAFSVNEIDFFHSKFFRWSGAEHFDSYFDRL